MDEMQNKFLHLSMGRLFRKLALPNMVSALVMSVYGIIDGIFIGKFVGGSALAAINLVMPIFMIAVALVDMIAIGTAVQMSIKLGEKDNKSASAIFSSAMLMKFAYSILFTILAILFFDDIVRLMGVKGEVAKLSEEYMWVYVLFSPIIMVSFALDNYLRVCGRATYSMIINVSVAILNIVLDYVFIVEWQMGVQGAALASCIAMALASVFSVTPFILKKLAVRFEKPRMSLKQFKDILFNGSSEFFTTIAVSLSAVIVNIVIIGLIGDIGIAAIGIVLYINNIILSLMYGMGDSLQPAISYSYGAKNIDRVWDIIKFAIKMGLFCALLVFFVLLLFREDAIRLFIKDSDRELFALTLSAMNIYMFAYLFSWLNTLASLFFTALNRPVESLVISLGHSLIFVVLGLAILPGIFGIDGVWLTFVFAKALTLLIACCLLVYKYRRTKMEQMFS